MKLKHLLLPFFIFTACTSSGVKDVTICTTSPQSQWQKSSVKLQKQATTDVDIEIVPTEGIIIEGFGGCFNELGWGALNLLSEAQRNEVLNSLFGEDGAHFTYCRLPVGANDYSRDYYSHNDTPGDFQMKHFSIERDHSALIPYIKSALAINPDIRLWASPWTPPVWMKATRHYATAPGNHNDFTKENEVEGDHFIQKPEYLTAYALYLSKFIEAYKENGINISMLQFQNEPYTKHQWPNCSWTPKAMANFIGNYLGPAFVKKHPKVALFFGTFNCNNMDDLTCVMEDPAASPYIKGIGLQWEGKDIVAKVREMYPYTSIMQTENECGSGTFDWGAAEHTFNLLQTYLNGGANSYMYWNMVLADDGASTWGWKQNAMIRIDSRTKEVTYTPEYYVMKHFSHYVKNGARMLDVTKGDNVLAFRNPDNQIVIICANKEDKERDVRIAYGDYTMDVKLMPKTFNTITF